MKKKIVYIIGGVYSPSGMGQVLTLKANYLAEHTDYQIHVVLTEKKGLPFFYQLSPKIKYVNFNINFDDLDTMPLAKKIFHFSTKQRKYKKMLKDYLIQLKPDITVSVIRREINFINSIPDGSIKVGEIHFNKGDYRNFNKSFLPIFINKAISKAWMNQLIKELKRLKRFVVLSNEDRERWTELDDVRVIHNPLSFFPETTSDCASSKIIAVGRYTWQKGFDRLIEAWSFIADKYPDWKLHIYGSGNREEYQNLALEKGVNDSLICEEATKNIIEKYQESSIFVLSSRYEGFGMVITEAMACGVPAISFTCPSGPSDIISNGIDGFLVPNDNTKALAEKIEYLITNEEERKRMGQEARRNVQRFNVDNIMKTWIELFDTVLSEKSNSL